MSTQLTMIANNRFWWSRCISNSWQQLCCDDGRTLLITAVVWRPVEQEPVLMCDRLKNWNQNISPAGEASECGYKISGANVLIVFHSNYGPIVLSFRDDHGTDDGRADRHWQPTHIWPLRRTILASPAMGHWGHVPPLALELAHLAISIYSV